MSSLFSVVTANFNHARYLTTCIESVAGQTHPVLEHIIVDDCSTDDSRLLLAELCTKHPHLHILYNDANRGAAYTFGRGLRQARGDYTIALSADDVLRPEAVERFVAVLRRDPGAALICGQAGFFDERNGRRWTRRFVECEGPIYLSPRRLISLQRSGFYVVTGAGAAIRRDAVLRAAYDDPDLRWHSDWFALAVIGYRFGLWYIPEEVHQFRVGAENDSKNSLAWNRQEPVLRRAFGMLESDQFSDVAPHFRESGFLGSWPLALRFLFANPRYWRQMSPATIRNAFVFALFRLVKRFIPVKVVNLYIKLRAYRAV